MKIIIDLNLFKDEPICTTLSCHCGATWRAHDKLTRQEAGDGFIHIVSEGCPNCGSNADIRSSRTDPENWNLQG